MVFSGPSLKHFILRQQALDLYRQAIRACKVIRDPVTRNETRTWIRSQFERNRYLTDTTHIEHQLRMIRRDLRSILPGQ